MKNDLLKNLIKAYEETPTMVLLSSRLSPKMFNLVKLAGNGSPTKGLRYILDAFEKDIIEACKERDDIFKKKNKRAS